MGATGVGFAHPSKSVRLQGKTEEDSRSAVVED
jgi:hypothetical protein